MFGGYTGCELNSGRAQTNYQNRLECQNSHEFLRKPISPGCRFVRLAAIKA